MDIREIETKVVKSIQRTHDVKSIRFAVPDDLEFKPGQFFLLTIKIKGEEVRKHFSMSNSPTEKGYIEVTKRITGSEFSHAMDVLKEGDWARIKLPFGAFTFEAGQEKIAFLSGGIGITPIRSMCKFATDKKLPLDIVLIFGNKTENDIIFHEDFLKIEAENKNLRVVYMLDNPLDEKSWKGRTGLMNSQVIKEEITDYMERVFYMCGPPAMVTYLRNMLSDELHIANEKIRFENFSGY